MAKRKMGNVNLFLLVPLIIYGGMIKYIIDLENSQLCPCSSTKNRTDLKNLLIMWVCLLLGSLLLQVVVKDKNMKAQLLNVIGILSVVVFIYFSIIFFKYESEMYKAKCECSEDIKRTVFKYYLYSIYVILVLQVLFIVFYILMVVYSSNQRGLAVVKENL
jgi:amino acid permease